MGATQVLEIAAEIPPTRKFLSILFSFFTSFLGAVAFYLGGAAPYGGSVSVFLFLVFAQTFLFVSIVLKN